MDIYSDKTKRDGDGEQGEVRESHKCIGKEGLVVGGAVEVTPSNILDVGAVW